LECGGEATAFTGSAAPCGDSHYRSLICLAWPDARTPR
jgi:hypothetical protein